MGVGIDRVVGIDRGSHCQRGSLCQTGVTSTSRLSSESLACLSLLTDVTRAHVHRAQENISNFYSLKSIKTLGF